MNENTRIETERLILRPWKETDAESLFTYARDERVAYPTGFPAHTSVENSREVIRTILSTPETYAVCRKEDGRVIGSIGLTVGKASNLCLSETEGELGYWIGVPFWGQGLIPEAARALIRRGFEDLHLTAIWCGYFEGNEKSKRVQEKCGFAYHHTNRDIFWKQTNEIRTEHVTRSEGKIGSNENPCFERQPQARAKRYHAYHPRLSGWHAGGCAAGHSRNTHRGAAY